jgi:hypothetical protein
MKSTDLDRIKFSRTFHLNWSLGQSDDDKTHDAKSIKKIFENREVIVTTKLDGEA